jgi:hypothetical protein
MMITLDDDRLTFRFPDVHPEAVCSVDFERTLRIPDDGRDYPLPPGFGGFPLRHLDDFANGVPRDWLKRGGVMMPMAQAEAMWISFGGGVRRGGYPFAVKIATGKINAVSGEPWTPHLNRDPQDYIVLPEQPWLDGYCVEKGVIRQFVAMPLGQDYSVEEQLTGEAEWGGVQILVYPMKADRYEMLERSRPDRDFIVNYCSPPSPDMGLAPGGRMRQEVYDDPYGLDAWDQRHSSRCFVTIANSITWRAITGERPPVQPLTAADYAKAGLPWFNFYDADAKALDGSGKLAKVKSVVEMGTSKGEEPLPENTSAEIEHIMRLRGRRTSAVREAIF